MSGATVALVIGGVAVAGGAAYLFLRAPPGSAGTARAAVASPSPSGGIGGLIAQIGGRAVSQGINSIESALSDRLSSYFS